MISDSMEKVWSDLAEVDCGPKLVNQFRLNTFIPNKWFDWSNINNIKVMIVGQDWGPNVFLNKYIVRYKTEHKQSDVDYDNFLLNTFSSRTEKMLVQSLQRSYKEKFGGEMTTSDWHQFFFTVAEMFCRSGKLFRGSENFDTKGIALSLPFLKRQIEIVKPKIIITLGDMALKQVIKSRDILIKYKNITQFVNENEYIIDKNMVIIPSFHPAAHVNPKVIYERLATVWALVANERN